MSKQQLLKAIREKCMDCCVYQTKEVRLCTVKKCQLWVFRFGKDPTRKKRPITPAMLAALAAGRKKRLAVIPKSSPAKSP